MTTSTRVRISLQQDSGSIIYQDSEDGVIFHIEAMQAPSVPESQEGYTGTESSEQLESTATTDLLKSFWRQHLLKNGQNSHSVTPLMRQKTIAPLVNAAMELELQSQMDTAASEGEHDHVAAAMSAMYKTIGLTVSMLQQRSKALNMARGLRGDDAQEGGDTQ